jgi:hypothetical protein
MVNHDAKSIVSMQTMKFEFWELFLDYDVQNSLLEMPGHGSELQFPISSTNMRGNN